MMNRYGCMYASISASIITLGYVILWISPDRPGCWKKAGKFRRSAFHFSLWFLALSLIAKFSFGLIAYGLTTPFYYLLPIVLFESITSSIVCVEICGTAIKSSIYWLGRKRLLVVVVLTLIIMGFMNLLTIQGRLIDNSVLSHKQEVPTERQILSNRKVSDLIDAPTKNLGEDRSSVQSRLGAPAAIKTEKIANIYVPRQTDLIHTLTYNGLDVLIYYVVSSKKEMLFCVRMTANHPGILPELIGHDEKAIRTTFGDPTRINGRTFEYDMGEERVQIEFGNSTVAVVQWNLSVD